MFKSYKVKSNALEIFRIKAHLRSYVKDPDTIDKNLLQNAVAKLKKLPYEHKDPAGPIAKKLVLEACHLGYFKYQDLTHSGCMMVKQAKYRRHPVTKERKHQNYMLRSHFIVKIA